MMLVRLIVGFLAAMTIILVGLPAMASFTATTPVVLVVREMNRIEVEQGMVTFPPLPVGSRSSHAEFTYSLVASGTRLRKITARLGEPLPSGVEIFLRLAPPNSGIGAGLLKLGVRDVELVSNVASARGRGRGYLTLEAAPSAPAGPACISLTLTIQSQ